MPHRLNYEQFFHVSPDYNRESIERHGLDTSRGNPQWEQTDPSNSEIAGNYLFHNISDARNHARNMASAGEEGPTDYYGDADKFDLYEVTIPNQVKDTLLQEDPILEDASMSQKPIPRSYIRRRESVGPWGEEI